MLRWERARIFAHAPRSCHPRSRDDPLRESLRDQGLVERWTPRLVTAQDIAVADVIVNIGCATSSIPTDRVMIEWDVPFLSEDFQGSMTALHDLAESLAHGL